MARYFSEGFNLYADSEVADIRGDVRFTIEDTTIAAQTQRGTNLYGFYNPIENGSHKPGSTIITIGYYVNNILVASSQIRITFVDTKVDLTEPMVAVGTTHTVALGQDGSVWVWGQNDKGQLGVGNTAIYDTNYEYPFNVLKADIDGKVEIGGQKVTVTKVHAGNGFTLLQVIDANNRSVVYVAGTAAGTAYGNEFTLMNVTDAEGTTITQVSAYGDHFIMVLGGNTGMFMVDGGEPVALADGLPASQVTKVAMAGNGAYLILTANGVYQGSNGDMILVPGLSNVTDIDAGSTFGAVSGGKVYLWLTEEEWTTTNQWSTAGQPVLVKGLNGDAEKDLTNVKSIHVGNGFAVAVTESGYAYAWGAAAVGQLGIGVDNRKDEDISNNKKTGFDVITTPTSVLKGETFNADSSPDLQSVLALSAGPERVTMVRADGFVYAWGKNTKVADKENMGIMGAHSVPADKIAAEPVQVGDMEAKTLVVYKADVIDGVTGQVKRTYTLNNLDDTTLLAPMNITVEQGDTIRIYYTTTRNDLLETYLSALDRKSVV